MHFKMQKQCNLNVRSKCILNALRIRKGMDCSLKALWWSADEADNLIWGLGQQRGNSDGHEDDHDQQEILEKTVINAGPQ